MIIKCKCGKQFLGLQDKEDTCSSCLKDIINRNIESDNAEIGRLIAEGCTSGILDNEDGYRIAWELKVNKFKH